MVAVVVGDDHMVELPQPGLAVAVCTIRSGSRWPGLPVSIRIDSPRGRDDQRGGAPFDVDPIDIQPLVGAARAAPAVKTQQPRSDITNTND